MAPNVFFVQRYLRDHNIDAMLAEAVNQAVERKEKDPAASLAKFFSQYSRRNGEITNISARTVMNLDLQPVLEVTVECFKNGGTQVAATTVGLLAIPAPPPVEGEEAAEEEGVKLEGEAALQALAERINTDVRAALLGSNVRTVPPSSNESSVVLLTRFFSPRVFPPTPVPPSARTLTSPALVLTVKRRHRDGPRISLPGRAATNKAPWICLSGRATTQGV